MKTENIKRKLEIYYLRKGGMPVKALAAQYCCGIGNIYNLCKQAELYLKESERKNPAAAPTSAKTIYSNQRWEPPRPGMRIVPARGHASGGMRR